MNILIILNEEMEDITKTVKRLEKFCLLNKSDSKTVENEAKRPKT